MTSTTPPLAIIIIGAGMGTRMKSSLAKVLHPLAGCPLIVHVLDLATRLAPQHLITVVEYQSEAVRAICEPHGAACVLQDPQLGTGHAVAQANAGDTIDLAAGTYPEPGLVIDKAVIIQGAGVIVQ